MITVTFPFWERVDLEWKQNKILMMDVLYVGIILNFYFVLFLAALLKKQKLGIR